MTLRLVSPDRKLFLMADEDDLKAVAELYKLTSKQKGNIRQLLGWVSVGNRSGDRNDRAERKESENFMLFHNIYWLKHDDGTEYVPLVGKPLTLVLAPWRRLSANSAFAHADAITADAAVVDPAAAVVDLAAHAAAAHAAAAHAAVAADPHHLVGSRVMLCGERHGGQRDKRRGV